MPNPAVPPRPAVLNTKVYDEIIRVKNEDAMNLARRMARAMRTLAALLFTFTLAACAHVPSLPSGARYVNMGSSFAAGAGVAPSAPGAPQRAFARSPAAVPTPSRRRRVRLPGGRDAAVLRRRGGHG